MFRISRPAAGENQSLQLDAGQSLALGFDAAQADVSRDENDLLFRFDNGGEIRVDDFFLTGGNALPSFVLEDGTEVAGADLLQQLDGGMDLATAAGPAAGAGPASGGSGDYDDATGALVGGTDRLGSLGTDFWARSTEAPEVAPAVALAALDAPDAAATPLGGATGETPEGVTNTPPVIDWGDTSIQVFPNYGVNEGEPLTMRVRCFDNKPEGPIAFTLKFEDDGDTRDVDYNFTKWAAEMGDRLSGPDPEGNYTLTVGPEEWTGSLHDNTGDHTAWDFTGISFETVGDMYMEDRELAFNLTFVRAEGSGGVELPLRGGSATDEGNTAYAYIKSDTGNPSVTFAISDADRQIYEDGLYGPEHRAVHTISFEAPGSPITPGGLSGLQAVENFTFKVSINGDGGTGNTGTGYDGNTENDDYYGGLGRIRWAFQPELDIRNVADLTSDDLDEINQWMQDQGYLPQSDLARIVGIDSKGTLTFEVDEGYSFDDEIRVPVVSVDTEKGDYAYTLYVSAHDGKNETANAGFPDRTGGGGNMLPPDEHPGRLPQGGGPERDAPRFPERPLAFRAKLCHAPGRRLA